MVTVNITKKKVKSGMLDKASANIDHKEIWPQKNLLEEFADAELEFKQMQYEHFIAGECRTIETCSEPEEIMGRLRLMRRTAYLKLRGNDWSTVTTMYAAILRSIKIGENIFDGFESIVNRKVKIEKEKDSKSTNQDRNKQDKRENRAGRELGEWYCRAYDRPEGCPENHSHWARIGHRD